MAKRRPSGDGMVRKKEDGSWEGRVVIGYDEKNLPKTKNVLAKTKSECVEKLKQLQEQYAPPKSDKIKLEMPFGEWMDFWYQNYSKPKLRPTTRSGYEGRIYRHIISELGNIPLDQLTQNDLQQFYARLKKSGRLLHAEHYGKGLSDRMVRACHMNCRSALEKAVQEGLIRMNPAVGCKLPPKKAREMQVLTREEIQRFLIHAKAEGYFELFLLELTTGLRRGELLALQWDDLNLETGELQVTKQVYRTKEDGLLISKPKTKSSIRTVSLPPTLLNILKEYKESVNSRWMFPAPVKEDSPLDPAYIRTRLHLILEHAQCKQIRFHDLRHPYVKHTTKKYNSEKQKTQATKMDLIAWVFRFLSSIIQRGHGLCKQSQCDCRGIHTPFQLANRSAPRSAHPLLQSSERSLVGCFGEPVLLASALPGR